MKINQERLLSRLDWAATFGANERGGVTRLALDQADVALRAAICDQARRRGFECFIDAAGNVFIRRGGKLRGTSAVTSGSHTDSQITGGKYDGILGVLAAFEVLETLEDFGVSTERPVEAVLWNAEEGSRFYPGALGSAIYAGLLQLESLLGTVDGDGQSLNSAIEKMRAAFVWDGERKLGTPMSALIELHIEQGPIMQDTDAQIGVVGGMQGNRRFLVDVIGSEAHSGTTPMRRRQDALMDAIRCISDLQKHFEDPNDITRFTVGDLRVFPCSYAVVPGRVIFTIDFRHPSQTVLNQLGDSVASVCERASQRCKVVVQERSRGQPVQFDTQLQSFIIAASERQKLRWMNITSGAGHDTRPFADLWPTAMIFIPCKDGISHNELESINPMDAISGASVLLDVISRVAGAEQGSGS